MNQATENALQEFILVTGEIVFRQKDDTENINAIRCNGVMVQETRNIGIYAMGKAQQILQANFLKKMEGTNIVILDVVLYNFEFLGRMTTEEFQRQPEGLKIQERTPPQGDALDQAIADAGGAANG